MDRQIQFRGTIKFKVLTEEDEAYESFCKVDLAKMWGLGKLHV